MRKKIIVIILMIVLTFQIVDAIGLPSRNIGIMPINFVVPDKNISNNSNAPQRTVFIKPTNDTLKQIPLKGDIVKLNDSEGYYVKLGDSDVSKNIIVTSSNITSNSIIVGKPIFMEQTINLKNKLNESLNNSINLWDYTDQIPEKNLREIVSVKILDHDELISESLLFNVNLKPDETKTFKIIYEYSPIQKKIACKEKSIIDFLPAGAIIKHTDLPLDTIVSKSCEVSIYHDGNIILKNVQIPLDEFDTDMITSIINLQTGNNLKIHDGTLTIPTQ